MRELYFKQGSTLLYGVLLISFSEQMAVGSGTDKTSETKNIVLEHCRVKIIEQDYIFRLFPGGEGSGSEVSEKPPPPVHPFHPKMIVRRGVLESECAQTMQQFFQLRRKKKDKNSEPPTRTDHHHHPSRFLNKMHQVLPFFCL